MDEKQMVSTNALRKQLDAAVVAAQPQFAGKFEAKAAAATAAGVTTAAITLPSTEGFCAICVRVRPFLNFGISVLGPLNPKLAQMAKTFMAVLYNTLIPMVCGAPK